MKKYIVTNERFSQDDWEGTADEIISSVISCNNAWGTNYNKDDFAIRNGKIYVQDSHPYGESVLAVAEID